MDALGVVANVIAVVDFGAKVTKILLESRDAIRGKSEELDDIETLTSGLSSSLKALQDQKIHANARGATNSKQCDDEIVALSKECQKTAEDLLTCVHQVQSTGTTKLERLKALLSYAKNDRIKIKNISKRLGEYRTQLDSRILISIRGDILAEALSSRQFLNSVQEYQKQIIKALQDDKRSLADIHDSIGNLQQYISEQDKTLRQLITATWPRRGVESIDQVYECLRYEGWNYRQNEMLPPYSTTGTWIIEDHTHDKWPSLPGYLARDDLNSVNWIAGMPGSGKSTLVKSLLEEHIDHVKLAMSESHDSKPGTVIVASHFFWSLGPALANNFKGMLRSLLFQMLKAQPDLKDEILTPLEIVPGDKAGLSHGMWAQGALMQAIMTTLTHLEARNHVCLMLDGLDECCPDSRHELVRFVKEVAKRWPCIRLVIASRTYFFHDGDFDDAFMATQLLVHEYTASDIQKYILENLQEEVVFRNLSQTDPNSTELLLSTIQAKARKIWAWVVIVVKSLRKLLKRSKTSMNLLLRETEALPIDLESLYNHTVGILEPSMRGECAALLICYAIISRENLFSKSQRFAFESFQTAIRLATFEVDDEYEMPRQHWCQVCQSVLFASGVESATGGLLLCDGLIWNETWPRADRCPAHGMKDCEIAPAVFHLSVLDWLKKVDTTQMLCAFLPSNIDMQAITFRALVSVIPFHLKVISLFDDFDKWAAMASIHHLVKPSSRKTHLALLEENLVLAYHNQADQNVAAPATDNRVWYELTRKLFFSKFGRLGDSYPEMTRNIDNPHALRSASEHTFRRFMLDFQVFALLEKQTASYSLLNYLAPKAEPASLSRLLLCVVLDLLPDSRTNRLRCIRQRSDLVSYVKLIQCLLDNGADPNACPRNHGVSAWMIWLLALSKISFEPLEPHLPITKRFVECGAEKIDALSVPTWAFGGTGAAEVLHPRLLRWMRQNSLFEGDVCTDINWDSRERSRDRDSIRREEVWVHSAKVLLVPHAVGCEVSLARRSEVPILQPSQNAQQGFISGCIWKRNQACRAILQEDQRSQDDANAEDT